MGIKKIKSKKICLDASTLCTLKCPLCPTASGETGKKLGRDFLRFSTFKEIVDKNPQVYSIELSNWGEVFLNKELTKIIEYAYMHNIALSAGNGANMNNPDEDLLEVLVKYKFRKITCAIDGASQETYPIYRVNGDFSRVIENIKTINRFKDQYNSFFPILHWRFIIFGHNAHEVGKAREMAKKLNMTFSTKLSWGDLYRKSFLPVENADLIRQESGLGVASREEFREKYGREYISNCCIAFWTSPYINYDGRLFGCSVNYLDDYGNILEDGLNECINSEKANYAREMLMGKQEEKDGIPCSNCKFYKWQKEKKNWFNNEDIKDVFNGNRTIIMLENKLFRYRLINELAKIAYIVKNQLSRRKTVNK
jgi:MoaA/NifB/PqqE/SkfB family radical SAM enzyme